MIVYFRTDASSYIGSGHVMRCITLAEELNNLGVSVVFITLNCQGNLNQYIRNKGFKISPISTTIPDNFKETNNSKLVMVETKTKKPKKTTKASPSKK